MKTIELIVALAIAGSVNNGATAREIEWLYRAESSTELLDCAVALAEDGTIFLGTNAGLLRAVTPSGKLLWEQRTGSQFVGFPTVSAGNTVYFSPSGSYLYHFSDSGKVLWKIDKPRIETSVAVSLDGTLYMNAEHLIALKPSGEIEWHVEVIRGGFSPVIGSDGTIYCMSEDKHLYAVDRNGAVKWKCHVGETAIEGSMAVDGNSTVYIPLVNGNAVAAVSARGVLKWSALVEDAVLTAVVADDRGRVYFGSHDHHLYCLNSDGTVRWKVRAERKIQTSPVIDSSRRIYFGAGSKLYAVDDSGSLLWIAEVGEALGWALCLSDDGKIVTGTEKGIITIGVGSGPLSGAWPMARCDAKRTGRAAVPHKQRH